MHDCVPGCTTYFSVDSAHLLQRRGSDSLIHTCILVYCRGSASDLAMTVSYADKVFSGGKLGPSFLFFKLLFRWKGTVYKLIWHDLVIYFSVYFTLSAIYRLVLEGESKHR